MPAMVESSWVLGPTEDDETLEGPDGDPDLDDLDADLDEDEDWDEDDDLDDDDDLIDLDDEYDDTDEEDRPHPGRFDE